MNCGTTSLHYMSINTLYQTKNLSDWGPSSPCDSIFYLAMLILLLWSNQSLWSSRINQSSQNLKIWGLDKPRRKKTTMDNQVAPYTSIENFLPHNSNNIFGVKRFPNHRRFVLLSFSRIPYQSCSKLSYRYLLQIHGEPTLMCHSKVSIRPRGQYHGIGYHK